MIEIGSFLDILLILYTCFLILALVKRIGIYSLLNLQRIRNLLFLLEGFFILGILAVVKLEHMRLGLILFTVILAGVFAIGYFFTKHKRYLKDAACIPHWVNRLNEIWHKRYRLITIVVIIVGSILNAFVYSAFKDKYHEYGNFVLSYAALFALCGTTLYLVLIILLEKKYGPIYYNRDKKDN
ncbi:hypothetical protein ES705_09061 [subsurface metagenome]